MSSNANPSITDQAVQAKLTNLNNQLPRLEQLLQRQQQNPNDPSLQKNTEQLVSKINTDIAMLETLNDDNVAYGQRVYNQIQEPVNVVNIEDLVLAGQQRFETIQHLAQESREAYLRKRKIMWLWVFLAVVLAGGMVYMYFWISGMGGRSEKTLANMPAQLPEVADTQAHSFSGKPYNASVPSHTNIFAGDDGHDGGHDGGHDEDDNTLFGIDEPEEHANDGPYEEPHEEPHEEDDDLFSTPSTEVPVEKPSSSLSSNASESPASADSSSSSSSSDASADPSSSSSSSDSSS